MQSLAPKFDSHIEKRNADRHNVELKLAARSGDCRLCLNVTNLSHTGFLAQSALAVSLGQTVTVELPDIGERDASVVWAGEGVAGYSFNDPIPRSVMSAAILSSALSKNKLSPFIPRPVHPAERLAAALRSGAFERPCREPGNRMTIEDRTALICFAAAVPWLIAGALALAW